MGYHTEARGGIDCVARFKECRIFRAGVIRTVHTLEAPSGRLGQCAVGGGCLVESTLEFLDTHLYRLVFAGV